MPQYVSHHLKIRLATDGKSIFCEILETLNKFSIVSKYLLPRNLCYLFRDVTPGCNGVLQTDILHSQEVCNN